VKPGHDGAQSNAPASGWLAAWHHSCLAVELWVAREHAGEFDHLPARVPLDRLEVLAKVAGLALVRSLDGRQN
jgi:hypothetical protein